MFNLAVAFFVAGLTSILLGANDVWGMNVEDGKVGLFKFLILSTICFIASLVEDKGAK